MLTLGLRWIGGGWGVVVFRVIFMWTPTLGKVELGLWKLCNTGCPKKHSYKIVWLMSPATNMLWDISYLKGGTCSSVWSTKTFIYDIREPRYKQNNMGYQILRNWIDEQSNFLKSDTAVTLTGETNFLGRDREFKLIKTYQKTETEKSLKLIFCTRRDRDETVSFLMY